MMAKLHPEDIKRDARMLRLAEREPLLSGAPSTTKHHRQRRASMLVGAVALLSAGAVITVKSQEPASSTLKASTKDETWESFKSKYGKAYATLDDEASSRANFEARLAQFEERNAANGAVVFGVTKHADRPLDDRAFKRGRRPRSADRDAARSHAGRIQLPAASTASIPGVVDWRDDDRGVVTPVKNQGQCGSCWAFSAAEQIESQLVLAGSPVVELSPQQLASCTSDPLVEGCCDGCGGGDPSAAYEYLVAAQTVSADLGGLAPEAFWPYSASLTPDGECEDPTCTETCDRDVATLAASYEFIGPYAFVTGYGLATPECAVGTCDHQNLTELAARVVDAPVSVCVNADAWDDYVGGVLSDAACGGHAAEDVDHCVQLVGYNADADSPYWIVRNSWSADWGEDGYIYLDFSDNTCGIANEATQVNVAGQWSQPALSKQQDPPSSS